MEGLGMEKLELFLRRSSDLKVKNRAGRRLPSALLSRQERLRVRLKSSEPDEWSEGHAQIVMRASGEVDFISGFQTQTNRTDVPFQTSTWINLPADIIRAQILDRTRETCQARGPRIQPEIDKSTLQRHERPDRPVAGHDFGANEPMQDFDVAVLKRDRSAARIRETFGECLLEVIAQLSLEHHTGEHLEGRASSQSHHVGLCLRDPEVIRVSPNLKMLLRRRQWHQPTCEK